MIKFVSKFVLEILPSIAATVIGAYIVNHYIIAKPATQPAAAVASTAVPATADADAKPPEARGNVKQAADKPAVAAVASSDKQAADKPVQHEHAAARTISVVSTPAESRRVAEEPREANELARAAIERLRASNAPVRPAEASARGHELQRASVVAIPSVQPLPPAINIATPAVEEPRPADGRQSMMQPRIAADAAASDPDRLIPPADIPFGSRPFGVSENRLENSSLASAVPHTTVADDMFAAARSVFHAVLPR